MHDGTLTKLVTEAVALDRDIAEKQERLKALKADIAEEAKARADEQAPTDGGGWSWAFSAEDGSIARVTRAGRTLRGEIPDDDKAMPKIRAAAARPSVFNALFAPITTYRPIPAFREEALSLLGKDGAAALVKLVTSAGRTSVSFETKQVIA